MSAVQQLLAAFGAPDAPSKTTTSVDLAPTTYFNRGADMTGVGDSATGTLSVWFRLDGRNASDRCILANPSGYVEVFLNTSNKVSYFAADAAIGSYLSVTSSSAFTVGATWHHLLASWDLNAAVNLKPKWLYVDDVLEHGSLLDSGGASVVEYTRGDWTVGSLDSITAPFDGCLAELWFAPGQYIDFSVAANRKKFRNAAGHPVDLGSDGSLPTGTAPALYLANDYTTFQTNKGTGGDFSLAAGALTDGSTSP